MSFRISVLAILLSVGLAACDSAPTSPTVTGPTLASPADGTVIGNSAQPVTLTVNNAVAGGSGALTYTFEVASDNGFTRIESTATVPRGAGAQTTATIATLSAGREYFWRVRATSGGTVGSNTAPFRFTIGAAVTIEAPVPVSPSAGGTGSQRPTLVVTNSTRSGPVGVVSYRFEIAGSAAFSPVVASGTVAEGAGTTSFAPGADLALDTTYYWRVQAVDQASAGTSGFSATRSFTTILTIDLRTVNYQRFVNVADWPETNRILSVDQDGGGSGPMCINHTKSGQWPTVPFLGDPSNHVEGSQWYLAQINGQWYAGAGEWLRPGQICKAGQLTEAIGPDGTWGGPMDTWRPRIGELVGYMVTTPARAWPDMRTIDERSNVVLRPWTENGRTSGSR